MKPGDDVLILEDEDVDVSRNVIKLWIADTLSFGILPLFDTLGELVP